MSRLKKLVHRFDWTDIHMAAKQRRTDMYSFKKSLVALVGLLALVGGLAALLPLIGRGQGGGNNLRTRDPRRSFYLTQTTHNGSQALTACAEGYHMASLWEIFDTSNLKYDTSLGFTLPDSGSGPPTSQDGWIRTGFVGGAGNFPGLANCSAWTSTAGGGTTVALPDRWDPTTLSRVTPWQPLLVACFEDPHVWCVQD